MCSICGFVNFSGADVCPKTVEEMGLTQTKRGPDDSGMFISDCVVFHHNRLAVMDPENGKQPMVITNAGQKYVICYNGEIYNCEELKCDLLSKGAFFKTNCDTEVVAWSYIIYGNDCPNHLNGIFAFAIYNIAEQKVFFARDRFGIKPFFYSLKDTSFLFASEMKALLKHPSITTKIDMSGLWQLLFLTPVTSPDVPIFKDICELPPACCGEFDNNGFSVNKYWNLVAKPFTHTRNEAILHTKELLTDAITRQLVSDVPLCTFLSGGLDSSVITSVATQYYRERGETLCSYSFEYEGNKQNFQKSQFQPAGDDEFAVSLAQYLGTNHTVLTAPTFEVSNRLAPAMRARDLPGQADIDSSLHYFCNQVKNNHTVALSGECSDEIFGGYPWFYRPEMLYRDFFPWIHEPMERISLFDKGFARPIDGYEAMSEIYKNTVKNCSTLPTDTETMRNSRIATVLSVNYFMASLLERKDRMSMASGLEVRVPFADHRILEFVYNVPWEIKFEHGVEKALLRNAMQEYLPSEILWRKKSPYPKTHNPEYRKQVTGLLQNRLEKGGILSQTLDKSALSNIMSGEDKTWFGQLMSTPQLIAWLIQFDCWWDEYNIDIIQ